MGGTGLGRREFFASACAFASVAGVSAGTAETIKFGVFADMHYNPGGWPNDSVEFLDKILDRVKNSGCELVFQMGDMLHGVHTKALKDYVKHYNDSPVSAYHVMGNHECDLSPHEEVYAAYRLERGGYYKVDRKGWRFIVLNPNFWLTGGKYVAYESENYWRKRKDGEPKYCMPPEQLEWLEDSVMNSPYPCVILAHESFERPYPDGAYDGLKVRKMVARANALFPGRVRLVMCGHHHVGHMSIIKGVPFWEVNGANFFSNGFKHDKYPAEYVATHRNANRVLAHKDPLSAIVTLCPNGKIQIDGKRSEWMFGVEPEMAGVPIFDDGGRLASDEIENYTFGG